VLESKGVKWVGYAACVRESWSPHTFLFGRL